MRSTGARPFVLARLVTTPVPHGSDGVRRQCGILLGPLESDGVLRSIDEEVTAADEQRGVLQTHFSSSPSLTGVKRLS